MARHPKRMGPRYSSCNRFVFYRDTALGNTRSCHHPFKREEALVPRRAFGPSSPGTLVPGVFGLRVIFLFSPMPYVFSWFKHPSNVAVRVPSTHTPGACRTAPANVLAYSLCVVKVLGYQHCTNAPIQLVSLYNVRVDPIAPGNGFNTQSLTRTPSVRFLRCFDLSPQENERLWWHRH